MKLVTHADDVRAVQTWLEDTAYAVRGSVLLVVGTPGCGASTMLESLTAAAGLECVWLSPSVPRLRAALRDAGASSISASGRRKLIVFEGFDAAMTDANAAADVADFVTRAMPAPAVFLAHRTRTVLKRFHELFKAASRHRGTLVELQAVDARTIAGVLRASDDTMSEARALELAAAARGDVRAALAAAAFDAQGRCGETTKDRVLESFSVVDAALEGTVTTVRDALAMAAGDPTVVSLGLFESYGLSPHVADAFSAADVMEEFMFGHQRWELADAHAALAVAYPAVSMSLASAAAARPPPSTVATKFSYGMVWSRAHLQAAKLRLTKTIATQRADAGLPANLSTLDLAWVRTMVMAADEAKDSAALAHVLHGMQPAGVLAIMRLWKGKYTQSMHSRVCKSLTMPRPTGSQKPTRSRAGSPPPPPV